MKLWKVKVRGYGQRPPKKLGKPWRPAEIERTVIVEANNDSEAFEAGERYLEATAPVSVRWHMFKTMEAATPVQLPFALPTGESSG